MENKTTEMMGVTFNGSVTFNGPMFDIHDNQQVTIHTHGKQAPDKSAAADGKAKDAQADVAKASAPVMTDEKPVVQETFADRVKAIMRKAATKNGQRIETTAKGHAGAYTYFINAEAFSKAMDEMADTYDQKLTEFLGGSTNCVQVTRVCFFIGHVVRMHVINDTSLQLADILFAFEDYYDNAQTVKAKLGDKKTTSEQDVFLGTFEGLLKKYKA